jgi:hypothetical protein
VLGASEDFAYGVAVAPDGDVVVTGAADGSPVLLRYCAEAFDVPQVKQVYVAGTAWAQPFRYRLAYDFQGSEAYGAALSDRYGARRTSFPWVNLDQVAVTFDRPVEVNRGDLHVRGVNVAKYGVADFRYDPAARTAVWTLNQRIGADKVVFELDAAKFGDQSRHIDVLPGDVNGDRAVLADDFSAVKRRFFKTAADTSWPTTPTPRRRTSTARARSWRTITRR